MTGRIARPVRLSLFAVLVVDSLTNGLFIPLSLLYLTTRTDASLAHVGVLLTVAALLALPLPVWGGRLVDRFGPRPVVLAAQVLQAAGFLGYVTVSGIPAVLASAVLVALGQNAFWASIYTLVGGLLDDDPDPRARERWFGLTGALRAAGYGIGAVLAGVAVSVDSIAVYRGLIAANLVFLVVAVVLILGFVPAAEPTQRPDDTRGYRTLLRDRPYLGLIGVNTVFALCNVLLSVGLPPYVAAEIPDARWAVGPLLGLNTVVQALCLPFVVRLTRRVPRQIALCLAGGFWAAWAGALLAGRHVAAALAVPVCALAVLCYSAAQMLHTPVSNAMAADAAPRDLRGRYLASFQYSFAIATVIAPTLFAALLGLHADAPWAVVAVAAAATIPVVLRLSRHLPPVALTGGGAAEKLTDGGDAEKLTGGGAAENLTDGGDAEKPVGGRSAEN